METTQNNTVVDYSVIEDKDLIKMYQKGDEKAVEELFSRYKDYIYHIAYRFMRNYEDSMDLMQEVLIRMLRGLKNYEERSYLKGWIYRIVSNTSINILKSSSKREVPVEKAFDWIADKRMDVEEKLESTVLKEKIYMAADRLKGKQRDIFVLRYYENLPYNEIANILGTSATSAKSNYFYALKKMKKYLEEYGVEL